jgi:hypothetical protein
MDSSPNSRANPIDPQFLPQEQSDEYQFVGEEAPGRIVQKNNSNLTFDDNQSMPIPSTIPAVIPEPPLPGVGLAFIVTKADNPDPGNGDDQHTFTTNVNQAMHPSVDDLNNSMPDGKVGSLPWVPVSAYPFYFIVLVVSSPPQNGTKGFISSRPTCCCILRTTPGPRGMSFYDISSSHH